MGKTTIILSDEAQEFVDNLPINAQKKIYYNIFKVEEGIIDITIFKKLNGTDIWEFRTLYNGVCYRLFAFWDTRTNTIIVATHGIIKKTDKTPKKEIAKAEAIMEAYLKIK